MNKRRNVPSVIPLSARQRSEFESLSSASGWRMLRKEEIPAAVPSGLREKVDSGMLIVAAASGSHTTYVGVNLYRADLKAAEIDHEPLLVAVTESGASTGGILVHHGDWPGRSFPLPPDFIDHVRESGIGNYFPFALPPGRRSGTLAELPRGDGQAFDTALRAMLYESDGSS